MEKQKLFFKAINLTMGHSGYSISLSNEDLDNYLPKVEKILSENKLLDENMQNLFIKDKENTYSNYKNYLLEILIQTGLGFLNQNKDKIIIDCPDEIVLISEQTVFEYNDIIHQICYVITDDEKFISTVKEPIKIKKI